jgi:N-glycosylase/DNA lyase
LKQVPHIRAVSLAIRRRYGRHLRLDGIELYAYPRAPVLGEASLDSLRECKLGFRAKNLLAAARMVTHGELDLDALHDLPVAEARARLCRVPGVGPKIANCVLLFAYGRLEVVPVDVWIHRAVSQIYLPDRKKRTGELAVQTFSEKFFGPYAGYAQQFLFHHWRMAYRRGR